MSQQPNTGFRELLSSMMKRRWFITAIVLGGFMMIMAGIFAAIIGKNEIGGEWKELLLLLLGAFIGSYGKIIDYWFSDTDKDKMLVQKMDEEDGVSLSNTSDMPDGPKPGSLPVMPQEFTDALNNSSMVSEPVVLTEEPIIVPKPAPVVGRMGVEIDEDGDGIMDGIDFDGDGIIDEYFAHRQCEHVWGDLDGDGEEECLKCGKIKDHE
jgi:hypothetical protein